MNIRIVADSSSDVLRLDKVPFASAPLSIIAGERTYVDTPGLDVMGMVADLRSHKGKSSTACPGLHDWLTAFGDADYVICLTITSQLSGSYNSAKIAAREYEELHPGRRVYVMDSLSTGPEMRLIAEKAEELIVSGLDFDAVVKGLSEYQHKTHLLFCLTSLHNLVMNGRVSPAIGALVGLLGIRVLGCASPKGELEIVGKHRGDRKALQAIINGMKERFYSGGKVHITHCNSESLASELRQRLLDVWPGAEIIIGPTRALCSFYAEEGGLLIGFEG